MGCTFQRVAARIIVDWRSTLLDKSGGVEYFTRFHCRNRDERGCRILAACRMELDMWLDSRRGPLTLLGLRLGFAGGGIPRD